jgi:hypothetical protein
LVIWQLHSRDEYSPPFQLILQTDSIYFVEIAAPSNNWVAKKAICSYSYLYKSTHTIRIELKEGIGNGAYIKVYLDGEIKYSRTTGIVGRTFQQDYPKFGTVYDFDNVLVNATSTSMRTRGRKFSLVTESFKVYLLSKVGYSNSNPAANAGSNQNITLPANSVTLSGSGSDADGSVKSYEWVKISGPSSFTIKSPNSATTQISDLVQGAYEFELTVTDDKGATGKDTVQVKVNVAANQSPTANAGSNQTITLPTNSVTLSGSGSDADGSIENYEWTKISGPSSFAIGNPNSTSTQISNLVAGTYQFELTVTDDQGATGKDTVQVRVSAAANQAPTANAGSNKTITLPTNSITLSGGGRDVDGAIESYAWVKISGPLSFTIKNPNSAATQISDLVQGTYEFELTVTDDKGATGKDTVQVKVNAAANIPPVADAGSDKTITLPSNTVTLTGSGSDTDGSIASYSWTKISGPSSYSIVSPSSSVTNVSGLAEGVYQFRFTVTDNNGASASSDVEVTVNPENNISPVANAGTNQAIQLPANAVTLSGSGSDEDGTISSYLWTKVSGPSSYTIVNPSSAEVNISNLTEGIYRFRLTVTDDKGASASSTVLVTVKAAPNVPPTSIAGSNQTITLPVNSVILNGSGSDTDGSIENYQWTKISGPSSFTIGSPNSASTQISNLIQGTYQFELAVEDDKGAIGKDTIQIKVNAAPNQMPTANAGSNKTITLPANSVTLNGSGSDADGSIKSYEWVKISGPSSFTIESPNSASTRISNLIAGTYQFELTVTDNQSGTGKDTVSIRVNAAANQAPMANAGSNKTITLPVNIATLNGNGNDADGTIESYQWIKISGPSSYNIVNANLPVTDVSGLIQGTYQFELTVTDNKGATDKDTVQVKVNAAANQAPTANAGSNKTTTLPINITTLSGSGSDADGSIKNYQWTKVSGPASYNIVNANSPVTDVSGLIQGTYQFELTVTDDKGATGRDTVQVKVNAAANQSPTANAGSNQTITLPVNSITLSGSGSDADGSVKSYEWVKISGPSSFTIKSPNSAATHISDLVQGTYEFELTVTDDKGATGKDIVQVKVNAGQSIVQSIPNVAPHANAGNDTTVISPVEFVTLNGGGTDVDGNVVSYLWRQISGPTSASILSENAAVTNVSNLSEGTYEFELTVTDNKGLTGKDSIKVTVALGRTGTDPIGIKVYPNPVYDIATLEINSGKESTNLMVIITDMNGKTVYRKSFVSSVSGVKEKVDMSNLTKGTYVITVFFDGMQKQSVKVMRM